MPLLPTLNIGCLAYWDSFSGPIPCKVLSLTGPSGNPSSQQKVAFVLTADRGPYKRGEKFADYWALRVFPRASLKVTPLGQYRIAPYTVSP